MSDFKLNSVNWQDGMLLSMQHLKDQDRHLEELTRWYAADVSDNYGLVKRSSDKPTLKITAALSGSRLKVELADCQAITPSGHYIEFNETVSGGEILKAEADIDETQVPVFIGVNSTAKKMVGQPDPSEEIPRIPFQMPNYTLCLIDPPALPENNYIQIAKLLINGAEVVQAPDYFPPCVTINADDRLSALAVDYRNRMENLLSLSTRAFMAVTSTGALEGASTTLQSAFKDTMYYLVYHMATHLDDLVVGHNAPHPGRMVIQFKKLFRVVSSLLNLHPGLKDYLNERFFSKELNSDVGKYMASVDTFLLSEYNHKDIAGSIQMIEGILGALRGLMAFLAQTKLEELGEQAVATETLTYQGKTYKNTAYKTSRLEQVGELSYLVLEIADPGPVNDTVILITKDLFTDAEWRSLQIRLGLNESRGLGETDPVDADTTTFGNKVAFHPRDMLQSSTVNQVTLIFRGTANAQKMANLGVTDLILYTI